MFIPVDQACLSRRGPVPQTDKCRATIRNADATPDTQGPRSRSSVYMNIDASWFPYPCWLKLFRPKSQVILPKSRGPGSERLRGVTSREALLDTRHIQVTSGQAQVGEAQATTYT